MSTAHIRRPADGKRHGNQFYRAGAGTNSQMGMTLCGADATSDDASWADMARKRAATWSLPDFGVVRTSPPAQVTGVRSAARRGHAKDGAGAPGWQVKDFLTKSLDTSVATAVRYSHDEPHRHPHRLAEATGQR